MTHSQQGFEAGHFSSREAMPATTILHYAPCLPKQVSERLSKGAPCQANLSSSGILQAPAYSKRISYFHFSDPHHGPASPTSLWGQGLSVRGLCFNLQVPSSLPSLVPGRHSILAE